MLWQKFLIEWPVQFLRQLWAERHTPLPDLLRKITWRKIVFVAVLLAAAYVFAQAFSLDMAFLMAGDVALYCEVVAAVMFVVVRGHVRQSVHTTKLAMADAMRRGRTAFRRLASARRRRSIKAPATRKNKADDDGSWLPGLQAMAVQH